MFLPASWYWPRSSSLTFRSHNRGQSSSCNESKCGSFHCAREDEGLLLCLSLSPFSLSLAIITTVPMFSSFMGKSPCWALWYTHMLSLLFAMAIFVRIRPFTIISKMHFQLSLSAPPHLPSSPLFLLSSRFHLIALLPSRGKSFGDFSLGMLPLPTEQTFILQPTPICHLPPTLKWNCFCHCHKWIPFVTIPRCFWKIPSFDYMWGG